jgi:hypothetical protein
MARIIELARIPSGTPNVLSVKYKTGEAIVKGSLVQYDANGELILCPADPVAGSGGVAGVALEAANSRPGWDAANSPTVVTGRKQEISIAVADRSQIFSSRMVNGGTDPETPAQTDVDTKFGVVKVGSDWAVDKADVVNVVVEIVDFDAGRKIVYWKFLEAVINLP